jgi:hypothetical protein
MEREEPALQARRALRAQRESIIGRCAPLSSDATVTAAAPPPQVALQSLEAELDASAREL